MISYMSHTFKGSRKICRKKLRRFNVGMVPKKLRHNQKGNVSPEAKDPKDAAKNRVYKFDCGDSKKGYIGETGQKMESRKYQHQNDVKNGKKMPSLCTCRHIIPIP